MLSGTVVNKRELTNESCSLAFSGESFAGLSSDPVCNGKLCGESNVGYGGEGGGGVPCGAEIVADDVPEC